MLFQTLTSLSHSSLLEMVTDIGHTASCLISCTEFSKIKRSDLLLLVEKGEKYMRPNHSSYFAIEEERFSVSTRVHAALAKMPSSYLKKEFRANVRCFLEEFCSAILSTVVASSKLGQGGSCFCPEIILGGNNQSTFFLYGQILDGLVECGREKGSNIEACKVEFQSFVREQRQQERHSTRKRPDVGNIVAYVYQQTGFQSRRHLFRVSSVLLERELHCNQKAPLFVVGVSNDNYVLYGIQFKNCPHSLWIWMGLSRAAEFLKHRLPACRALCVRPALLSVISSPIIKLFCLCLPSMLLGLSRTNRLLNLGRICCLRGMRPLLSI